jgi:hypothetical protein
MQIISLERKMAIGFTPVLGYVKDNLTSREILRLRSSVGRAADS